MLRLRVERAAKIAAQVVSYELRPTEGAALPAFAAGAHIDLYLPNSLVRSYSLVNSQDERHRYVIAVNRDAASRGGSEWVHANLAPGGTIAVAAPRNNFPLAENAQYSLLIAGGIGITPLWSMIQRLDAIGRCWRLIYCARTPGHAAFRAGLARFGDAVQFNFDHVPGGAMLDVAAVVKSAPDDAHLYCCGPVPLLEAFEFACASRPAANVHVEYFAPKAPAAADREFTIVLARTGRDFRVPPGRTIIDTLIQNGIDVPYSCLEGVCGTCETRVIEGIPEHRDLVLSKGERESNRTMMICCSRSRTDKLVLDS